ncbi:MAG: glycoside hydrolase domain-containing protein, partial [bacterium]
PYAGEPRADREDGRVWGDDSLELFLRPDFGARSEYNFVMNPRGARSEGFRDNTTDTHWTTEWDGDARIIEHGWEGEVRIPFDSLDEAAPQAGDTWEMLVTHIQRTPSMEIGASSFIRTWTTVQDFGYLRFGEPSMPAVRAVRGGRISDREAGALIELIGGETSRDVEVRGELYRPNTRTQDYFELVESAADPLGGVAEGKGVTVSASRVMEQVLPEYELAAQWTERVTVEAGQSRRVPIFEPVEYGRYVFHYRAIDSETGRLLAGETLPFELQPPLAVQIEPYLLMAQALAVETDYRRIEGVASDAQVVAELLEPGGGDVLERATAPADPETRRTVLELSTADRLGNTYDVRTQLIAADGEVLVEQMTEGYELPEAPEWWGNDFGRIEALEIVPEPWTPIEATSTGFAVWGRTVELDEWLTPVQIEHHQVPQTGQPTRTEPMLAAPTELELVIDGEPATIGEVRTVESEPWVLRREADVSAPGVSGTLTLRVEFDGLMRYRLDLDAPRDQTPRIDRLRLIYRVPRDNATHYNHGWVGTTLENRGAYKTGALSDEGLSMRFTEKLWLGSDILGLDWVAEWDRWWAPLDNPEAVTVDIEGDEAVLRVTMVDGAQDNGARTIDEPMYFEWALLPTPMKPIQDKYRSHNLRLSQGGLSHDPETGTIDEQALREQFEKRVEAGINAYNVWAWGRGEHRSTPNLWNPDFAQPGLNPDYEHNRVRERLLARSAEIAYEAGVRYLTLYMLWASPPRDWPGVGTFISEMRLHPVRPSYGGYALEPTPVLQDWYLHTLKHTIEATGITGMYQDSAAHPRFSANPYTGSGWYDDNGNLRGRFPIFDNREFHKRIWVLFHEEMGDDALIYAHNTHLHFPVVESFVDIHHAGEGSSLVHDHMVPKWYGYPIGNPTTWTRWNKPPYDETRMRSWRMALLMDLDLKTTSTMLTEPRFINERNYNETTYPVRHIWDARAKYPWDGSVFVPGWRAEAFVQTSHDDIMASLHYNEGRAVLLTVSSFLDEAHNARISLDWDKLGLDPDQVTITDVVLGEEVALEDGRLPLKILDNRWRMVLIESTR